MTTTDVQDRDLLAHRLNLRDLADAGGVVPGLVFRSAELVATDPAVTQALGGLGLRAVYDLRTADERSQAPDQLPAGARAVVLDVFGEASDLAPAQLQQVVADPAQAAAVLGDVDIAGVLTQAYRGLVSLPSAVTSYRRLFTDLADDATGPALFHCTAGKDRTGWGAAALLLFLGVPDEAVVADYLASNASTRQLFGPQLDAFAAAGGDPQLLLPLFQVDRSYLDAALDEVATRFGNIDGYVSRGLGIDAATQQALRRRLATG